MKSIEKEELIQNLLLSLSSSHYLIYHRSFQIFLNFHDVLCLSSTDKEEILRIICSRILECDEPLLYKSSSSLSYFLSNKRLHSPLSIFDFKHFFLVLFKNLQIK
jgi:hypothetical protein